MDATSCPTTATTPLRRFSPPDSSKRWKSHLQGQSSLSFAPTGRATQLLVSGTRSNAHKGNILQVLCSKKSEVPVLEARFMYEVYDALAERLLPNAAAASYPNLKHIVGLAGPPGAGKSTVASEVVQRVNELWPQKAPSFAEEVNSPDVATVLPMDGFHLYRHQLDAMEDPKEAHARRGAPWTFDPARLLKCLQTLRTQGYVYAPSFDHGVGDPIEDDIFVTVQHKVVVVEGNYLLLEEAVWNEISRILDEKWFIDVDIDKAMERVTKRHISSKQCQKHNLCIQIPIAKWLVKLVCFVYPATAGKPPDVAKWRVIFVKSSCDIQEFGAFVTFWMANLMPKDF